MINSSLSLLGNSREIKEEFKLREKKNVKVGFGIYKKEWNQHYYFM